MFEKIWATVGKPVLWAQTNYLLTYENETFLLFSLFLDEFPRTSAHFLSAQTSATFFGVVAWNSYYFYKTSLVEKLDWSTN